MSEEGGKFGEGMLYKTTILDRFFSKATFDMLEVSSNYTIHENTIFSKEGYSRVYNILKYPPKVYYQSERGFVSIILDNISTLDNFKSHVDFYFESFNKPYQIRFDKKAEGRRDGLIRLKRDIEGGVEDKGKGSKSRNKEIAKYAQDVNHLRLQEVEKKLNSYRIVKENQRIGKTQIESYQFIRVVCENKEDLLEAEKTLTEHMSSWGVSIKQVKDVTNYLESFSPISGLYNMDKNNSFVPVMFTSDAYPTLFNTPTRLTENDLKGLSRLLYVGASVKDKEPLALSLTSSGNGQNIVIVGTTGSGKTVLFENMAMQMALHGFKINAMDYKGNEYDFLFELLPNSIKLDFSNKSSFFVNSLKFHNSLYGGLDKEEKKAIFTENKNFTVESLLVLSSAPKHMHASAKSLLSYLLDSVFINHSIHYNEPSTYFRTHEIDFRRDIYKELTRLEKELTLWERYGKDVCNAISNALQPYFFEYAPESRMFTHEFDIEQIVTADAIIYAFGMNQNSPWDTTMEYKVLIQDYITNKFIARNKSLGLTTVNSIEEYQRAVLEESTKRIYNNKLSGGRSDNVINIIMTNTIAPLLQNDLDISAVRENISTKFISRIEDAVALDRLCETYNLGEEGKTKILNAGSLNHAFYCDYNTGLQRGSEIISVILPPSVQKLLETKKIDE